MANQQFLKGECAACGGHLEFPAGGADQTIACPHCGQPTKLLPIFSARSLPSTSGLMVWLILAVVLSVSTVAAFWYISHQAAIPLPISTTNHLATVTPPSPPVSPVTPPAPVPPPPSPPPAPPQPEVSELQPGETRTNEFIITAAHLDPTPGSSLVYVTGKVRNPTDRQRFGVKVRFALLDATGATIGSATDYQPMLDPHGEWTFKALVMESKTVTAQLSGISEDK